MRIKLRKTRLFHISTTLGWSLFTKSLLNSGPFFVGGSYIYVNFRTWATWSLVAHFPEIIFVTIENTVLRAQIVSSNRRLVSRARTFIVTSQNSYI
jgi:hypothetical protein